MRDYFLKIFGLAGVQAVSVEFEDFPPPPWKFIKDQMFSSDALFLLIGPNVIDRGIYTQNWISYEVGLASQLGKEIWVFEQIGVPVRFPVPYLDDYVLYDPRNSEHLAYIRHTIETYKRIPILRSFPAIYSYVTCPSCSISFNLCTETLMFECPSCREPIKFV